MSFFERTTPAKSRAKPKKVTVTSVNDSAWVPVQVPMKKKNKDGTPKTYTKKVYQCKACGYKNAIQTKYCPDCGKRCKK